MIFYISLTGIYTTKRKKKKKEKEKKKKKKKKGISKRFILVYNTMHNIFAKHIVFN